MSGTNKVTHALAVSYNQGNLPIVSAAFLEDLPCMNYDVNDITVQSKREWKLKTERVNYNVTKCWEDLRYRPVDSSIVLNED